MSHNATTGIVFVLLLGALRLFEVFWLARKKEKGRIVSGWTIIALSSGYAVLLIMSFMEYVLTGSRINILVTAAGGVLMLVRVPLKLWSARTLDKYWSYNIEIRESHKLVRDGPYRYMRHPAYLSAILDSVGIPLLFNSYFTLMTAAFALVALIIYRMTEEEKVLSVHFGQDYEKYSEETGALLPFKYLFHSRSAGKGGE